MDKPKPIPKPRPLPQLQRIEIPKSDGTFIKPSQVVLRSPNLELQRLENERNYWIRIIQDANKGVFPIWTVGLGGGGAALGKKDSSKWVLGILGAWLGNEIDSARANEKAEKAPRVIANAQKKIGQIDAEIRRIRKVNSRIQDFQISNILKPVGEDTMKFGEILTGEAYRNMEIPSIGLKGKWNVLMGDPSPGFSLLISGIPGNGKSTTAIQLTEYLNRNHGRAIFLASEQRGQNKPLQMLLERFKATFDIWTKPSNDLDVISQKIKGYDFVTIDSVNNLKLQPEEIEQLRERNPKASFISVMQSTKDGRIRGSQEFLHNCDIHVKMEDFIAKQTKSRFAAPMQMLMD